MISSCRDLVILVSASFTSREVKISPHVPLSGHSESCVISGVTLGSWPTLVTSKTQGFLGAVIEWPDITPR